jgi:GxxExxY protein
VEKSEYEYLARQIFFSALEVHKAVGPGLLESVYHHCFCEELSIRKINVAKQVKVPLYYKSTDTKKQFYIDILVEKEIIIELKAIETIAPVHEAQILSYHRLTKRKMGFLINFNVVLLKDGFKRFVNEY